jgi:hypothetical protein
MNAAVRAHRFHGYGVGIGGEVKLTHLQFADDTIILGEKSWLNVRTVRAVLLLFEEVSGLKVNFNKSMLAGVNISDSWLSEAALIMSCRRGIFRLSIWACLSVVIQGNSAFGNLLSIALPLAGRRGTINSFLSVAVWFF